MSMIPDTKSSAGSTFEVVIEKRRRWLLSLVATLPVLLLAGGADELVCPCRVTVRRRSGHATVVSYTYEYMSEANRHYGLILERLDSDSVPDFLTYLGL